MRATGSFSNAACRAAGVYTDILGIAGLPALWSSGMDWFSRESCCVGSGGRKSWVSFAGFKPGGSVESVFFFVVYAGVSIQLL